MPKPRKPAGKPAYKKFPTDNEPVHPRHKLKSSDLSNCGASDEKTARKPDKATKYHASEPKIKLSAPRESFGRRLPVKNDKQLALEKLTKELERRAAQILQSQGKSGLLSKSNKNSAKYQSSIFNPISAEQLSSEFNRDE